MASKVISLSATLAAGTPLSLQTNVIGFTPDECVIKHISYFDAKADENSAGLYAITTSLSSETVASFSPTFWYNTPNTTYYYSCDCSPNISLKLPNGALSSIDFRVANQISGYSTQGKICITLEFIRHKV